MPSTDPPAPAPATAPAPAATETPAPRQDIGTALGPLSGVQAAASATGQAAPQGVTGGPSVPLVSFDAPTPFAPRSLAGGLRRAPAATVVQVAIRRGGQRHGCGWWARSSARFTAARRASCGAPRWMPASMRRVSGGWRWRVALGRSLAPGSYRFLVRVVDAGGHPLAFERL